jgi:hypothetical protein
MERSPAPTITKRRIPIPNPLFAGLVALLHKTAARDSLTQPQVEFWGDLLRKYLKR